MQRASKKVFGTIGTRGSPLALYQARHVQQLLCAAHDLTEEDVPLKIFTTSGDKLKGELKDFGGKGLFTKELEEALLSGEIDMAVHSMKDVPTTQQPGLELGAILEREDPRDAFISHQVSHLAHLPKGAVIGTASIRRRAQLAHQRPDLRFTLLRGNVGTRLAKLEAGECDATFLACAGLKRLGQADVITESIPTSTMLPAPAQGAIGIEIRADDIELHDAFKPLNHIPTHIAISCERAFLKALDGSCRTPIAALATYDDQYLEFRGEVFSEDGRQYFSCQDTQAVTNAQQAATLGERLGQDLLTEIGGQPLWAKG